MIKIKTKTKMTTDSRATHTDTHSHLIPACFYSISPHDEDDRDAPASLLALIHREKPLSEPWALQDSWCLLVNVSPV